MCKYVKYCICMAVFYLLLTDGARGNPVNTDSNCLDEIVRDHEQMRHVNKVLHSMGKVLEDNLYILYNKLISLSQVSDLIVQQGQNAQIIQGTADEMSVRCPKGFQAVAGDRTCYHFSTYKAPWPLAREYCLQKGPNVDMLSIETTKKQFIVSHLLQSDEAAKQVKRWWTSGRSSVSSSGRVSWIWYRRLSIKNFFLKLFHRREEQMQSSEREHCVVLDADNFYQWKRVPCRSQGATSTGNTVDYSTFPSHHFICQTPAVESSRVTESDTENSDRETLATTERPPANNDHQEEPESSKVQTRQQSDIL